MNQTQEIGYVVSSRDFLVYLDGLPSIRVFDLVESEGLRGWVNSLADDKVEVWMLDEGRITPKQQFRRLETKLEVSVGEYLLGRAINPLGIPIDGRGPLSKTKDATVLELEQEAPGLEKRQFTTDQFITGITLIDTLLPIARGQRELILGDAHSGKSSFLTDVIVNQRGTGVICIVASIGKPAVVVRNLIDVLRANKALDYTTIIATSSSEPAPLIFLTPKTAITLAEYFQRQGKHVLLILDDLISHAKIYREISLLGNKSPGKESYPGDIFYQQAHLIERAGNFNSSNGGGSITALPVAEINLSDFTTLIPTNLMSMTDGHLLFKSSLYNQGIRPAVDIFLSVTRVGRQTQNRVSNLISSKVRQLLSTASDLETISRFSSELSAETQLILKRRDLIEEILKQDPLTTIPMQIQAILLVLPFTSLFQEKGKTFVEKYKRALISAFLKKPDLVNIAQQVSLMKSEEELIRSLETAMPTLRNLSP